MKCRCDRRGSRRQKRASAPVFFCRWRKRTSPAAQPGHDVDCGRAWRGETGGGLPSCGPADSCLFLRHASFSPSFVPLCLAPPPTFPPRRLSLELVPRSAPCFSSIPGAPFRLPRAPSPRRALLRFLSHRLSRTACPDSCFRCLLPSFSLSALPHLTLFSRSPHGGCLAFSRALRYFPQASSLPDCPCRGVSFCDRRCRFRTLSAPRPFFPARPAAPPPPRRRCDFYVGAAPFLTSCLTEHECIVHADVLCTLRHGDGFRAERRSGVEPAVSAVKLLERRA